MNELKTLEDIPIPNRTFTRRILKAEAVKKINFIRKEGKLPDGCLLKAAEGYVVTRFIMWDNNLKEEDLR